jgi:hypothetical protein
MVLQIGKFFLPPDGDDYNVTSVGDEEHDSTH